MSRFSRIFIVALFALPLFGSELLAQRPLDRFQGWRPDGRILRELFGENERDNNEREGDDKKQQRSRSQASKRSGQPTPARPRRQTQQNNDRQVSGSRNSNQPKTTSSQRERSAKKQPTRLEASFRESEKPQGLIVEKASKRGAAWAAGIRQGDLITKVGGLEISGKEELASILDVLKEGDQIEFEYVRRGKSDTTIVQFGEPREVDDNDQNVTTAPSSTSGKAIAEYNRPRRTTNSSLKSVLDIDGSLLKNGSSRAPNPSSARNAAPGRQNNWQVQPPTSGRSRTAPAYQRPASNSAEVLNLRRELEKKQREIQSLQDQIRRASDAPKTESQSDLDSLFDIDK